MDRQISKMKGYRYAVDILIDFYRLGLSFEVEGGMLRVMPKSLLTDEVAKLIRVYKPKLIRILESEMARGIPCQVCGWRGDTFDGYCEWHIDFVVEAEAEGCELISCFV